MVETRTLLLRLLVPPLACLVAGGVHYAINLPKAKMEPSTRQGKKKKKKPPDRIKRSDEKFEARDPDEVKYLAASWGKKSLDREPELQAFADRHRSLLNAAVIEAKRRALDGMPDPIEFQQEIECRTIRCRVWLCGWPHEVELIESELERLELDGASAFLLYEVEYGEPPAILLGGPARRSGADAGIESGPDACLVVTMALSRDLPDRRDLIFPDLEPGQATSEEDEPEVENH